MNERQKYRIDLPRAKRAIRHYNQDVLLLATNRLLARTFVDSRPLDLETIAERVVLLDALWATQLYRQWHTARAITQRLASRLPAHLSQIKELPQDAMESDAGREHVMEAARAVLDLILKLDLDPDGRKHAQHYSFATKFLHWMRLDLFPVVDSRTRKTIAEIQKTHGVTPRVSVYSTRECVDDYGLWVEFYSDLIRSLTGSEHDALLKADRKSQPAGNILPSTLLRVLDKAFYMWHDESVAESPSVDCKVH